jgi:hypothetical protein
MPRTTSPKQAARVERLRELIQTHCVDILNQPTGEDLGRYLYSGDKLPRWAAVTVTADEGYIEVFDTKEEATNHAAGALHDGVHPARPYAVVDLDSGAHTRPEISATWAAGKSARTASRA